MPKYIVVTGGVVSSLGKGIAASSLGLLLKARGLRVTLQKLDPYLNVDPGTMSPFQHGEVFVTDDGAETDLDLGHYERFTGTSVTRSHNVTAGQVYDTILSKERRGDYLGRTVQVIPHVTDEIKRRITNLALTSQADVQIIEIGGTVGDIESLPFLEAVRQLRLELRRDLLFVHVTLVPFIKVAGEVKTKPTQHSVRELREIGIQPDVLLCRSEVELDGEVREKIALFCNVPTEAVFAATDRPSIYEVPLMLHEGGLDSLVVQQLGLDTDAPDLRVWSDFVARVRAPERECEIAIVGKYTHVRDAYKSLTEALVHAGAANRARVRLRWVEAADAETRPAAELLADVDGVLVPGGFGERWILLHLGFGRAERGETCGQLLHQNRVFRAIHQVLGQQPQGIPEFQIGSIRDGVPERQDPIDHGRVEPGHAEQRLDKAVQRRAVTFYLTFEPVCTPRHGNRRLVLPDRAAQEHGVAGPNPLHTQRNSRLERTDAGSVDVQTLVSPALDDLGVVVEREVHVHRGAQVGELRVRELALLVREDHLGVPLHLPGLHSPGGALEVDFHGVPVRRHDIGPLLREVLREGRRRDGGGDEHGHDAETEEGAGAGEGDVDAGGEDEHAADDHDAQAETGGLDVGRFAAVVFTLGPIGWLIEALVTAAIIGYVARVRPGLIFRGALASTERPRYGDEQGGH